MAVETVISLPDQFAPKLLQHDRQRQNLHLHVAMQRVELRLKFVGHLNRPPHPLNMVQSTYDVNYILLPRRAVELRTQDHSRRATYPDRETSLRRARCALSWSRSTFFGRRRV